MENIQNSRSKRPNLLDTVMGQKYRDILGNRLKEYDGMVGDAHRFVFDSLGLRFILPADNIAVISLESASQLGDALESNGGKYFPELDIAYVIYKATDKKRLKNYE